MTNIIILSPHDSPAAIATDAEHKKSDEFNLGNIFTAERQRTAC